MALDRKSKLLGGKDSMKNIIYKKNNGGSILSFHEFFIDGFTFDLVYIELRQT